MTSREYFQSVLDAHISEEMDAASIKLIERLDAKNEKRKNTPTKDQVAAKERRDAVHSFLKEQSEPVTRDTIAEALNITPGQATAACKALAEVVKKSEVKVGKTRKVAYAIAE